MSILKATHSHVNKNPSNIGTSAEVELAEFIYDNHPPEGVDLKLTDVSSKDDIWDKQKFKNTVVGDIYQLNSEFERYAERMSDCAGFLGFGIGSDGLKLKQASFCRVRHCPVCQWRKSLFWKANMYRAYEEIKSEYPTHRWLFLTLTVRNCEITELGETMKRMNHAFSKMTRRVAFMKAVDGFVKTMEVTKPKGKTADTHAHPHFHVMLLVKPSYFGKNYLKHSDWRDMWASCLKVDYLPQVNIKRVKPKKGREDTEEEAVKAGIMETLKYAVKPADLADNPEWLYELTRQCFKKRFIVTGGVLKDCVKPEDDVTDEDLIHSDDESEDETDERRLVFTFNRKKFAYHYNPYFNQ